MPPVHAVPATVTTTATTTTKTDGFRSASVDAIVVDRARRRRPIAGARDDDDRAIIAEDDGDGPGDRSSSARLPPARLRRRLAGADDDDRPGPSHRRRGGNRRRRLPVGGYCCDNSNGINNNNNNNNNGNNSINDKKKQIFREGCVRGNPSSWRMICLLGVACAHCILCSHGFDLYNPRRNNNGNDEYESSSSGIIVDKGEILRFYMGQSSSTPVAAVASPVVSRSNLSYYSHKKDNDKITYGNSGSSHEKGNDKATNSNGIGNGIGNGEANGDGDGNGDGNDDGNENTNETGIGNVNGEGEGKGQSDGIINHNEEDYMGNQQGNGLKGMIQFGSVHSASSSSLSSSSASSFAVGGSSGSSSSSSSSSSYSDGGSSNGRCPPSSCRDVGTYDLLPVYPDCREYMLCQHGQLTLMFSCPEGTAFDVRRKRCEEGGRAECACVTTDDGDDERGGDDGEGEDDDDEGKTAIGTAAAGDASAGGAAAPDDAEKTPSSGSMTATTSATSRLNDELSEVCRSSSDLHPLLSTGCAEYVHCLNGRVVQRQACAEGLLFDGGMMGCNWKDLVDCPPYNDDDDGGGGGEVGGGGDSGDGGSGGGSLGSISIGSISFGNGNDNDDVGDDDDDDYDGDIYTGSNGGQGAGVIIVEPSEQDNMDVKNNVPSQTILEIAEAEADAICKGQFSAMLPLETTGCLYYVSCLDNKKAFIQSCAPGMLYDISMNGCNWDYLVNCPTMSPTLKPTQRPTRGAPATPRPSPPPTPGPTRDPTPDPTREPTDPPTGRPTRRPRPAPRPTPPPTPATSRPTNRPTPGAAPPDVFDWLQDHRRELNREVFRSYTQEGVAYRSYWFQYQDFYMALDVAARGGGDGYGGGGGDGDGGSITGLDKHRFYVGDEPEDWEYGLVNIAAFLAHAMTESIADDACDEFHWEQNTDAASGGNGANKGVKINNHYAISNSCGQNGQNYQEYSCPATEKHMACAIDRNMRLEATTSSVYPNAPPPLSCRPRSTGESYTGYWDVGQGKELNFFPYENSYGRTDVEGCCYWGRGAIHSKGICNLGKINYYLGKRAADDGRKSRYPTTDFCAYPEAICAAPESREMRWITGMFEWAERVQSYDDLKGWNYKRKLKEFVDNGLVDFEFLEATSGILTKGCHDPPCLGSGPGKSGGWGSGDVHLAEERVKNFQTVLIALEAGGEEALLRALIRYFSERTDVMNSQVLRSQTPQGQLYPSYRYQLGDFLSSLTFVSETGIGGRKFYMGEARVPEGVRYGIVNAIMFLSQAYKESIQYDACDENNWQLVNDRFPLSNSCGQLGMSYQDMHCREDEAFMECPVKRDMKQVALTSAQWFQAPAPFKCGPRSQYPTTGFWDYDAGRENNDDAYANARGRVDVEGCCWWGRGIIQTRGTCNYGKLNYYLGKRAALEGRPSLYPDIDFCNFPQGVCSSDETYGGELQWMVGLFEWADRVQTYDVDGWNYLEKLREFTDGGYKDFSFVDAVSGIVNIGCHDPPCLGFSDSVVDPHNKRDRNDTFQRFLNQLQVARNFRPPPKPTPMPSPEPTELPTPGVPTTGEPTILDPPTESPTVTAMPSALMGRPPDEAIEDLDPRLDQYKARFSDLVLLSEHPSGELWPSYLYTWNGFRNALKKMTTGVGPGEKNFFYIGDGYSRNSVEYGLVNIAAFVAEGVAQSIYWDACDENSWEMVNFRYPISNSCGQEGMNYQNDVCDESDESEAGMECEVDNSMEVHGVTHARWVGAPPPMYCADRTVGYWDHVTGLEEHDPPFKNKRGRSDIKGCCWWGRGVLQVRGVCSYGKLNHWIGAKAAAENRPSIYPEIDFCKSPGAICSHSKLSHELRWVTGMFHWVRTAQRSREYDYFPVLKDFVDRGDYGRDGSFIRMVNAMLGGKPQDIERRTGAFLNVLRAFNLIKVETNSTGPEEPNGISYCGTGWSDAASKCKLCESHMDCEGRELCYAGVEPTCNVVKDAVDTNAVGGFIEDDAATNNMDGINGTMGVDTTLGANNTEVVTDAVPIAMSLMSDAALKTNYCGESWGDAASRCASGCPSGTDIECPPGHYCFGDITTCSNNNSGINSDHGAVATTNYCGMDWSDAHSRCSKTCPGGADAECPPYHSCFGDIHC